MAHVLPEQLPQGGEILLLQPGLIVVLVALEGFAGIQGQQLHCFHTPQQLRQGADAAPDPLGGQDGEVVRADQIKNQLTSGRLQAVIGELVNPHELPGGQMPPQLFFLFSVQVDTSYIICIPIPGILINSWEGLLENISCKNCRPPSCAAF